MAYFPGPLMHPSIITNLHLASVFAPAQPSNEIVAGQLGVCEGTIRNYRGQLENDGSLNAAVIVIGKSDAVPKATVVGCMIIS